MESSWRRAWADTEKFRQSSKLWFWMVEIVGGGAVFGIIGSLIGGNLTPPSATIFYQNAYPTIGGGIGVVIGFAIVFLLIFIWNLFTAPYKQRNEAIKQIRNVEIKSQEEISQLKGELDNIKNEKPIIQISPITNCNRAYLKIHNSGASAIFTARAKVIDGIIRTEYYDMFWNAERQINNNDESSILVGEYTSEGVLVLYKIVDSQKEKLLVSDPEILKNYQLSKRYPTMYEKGTTFKDKCIIEVLITSVPSPKEVSTSQKYVVEVNHQDEHILSFTNLPLSSI